VQRRDLAREPMDHLGAEFSIGSDDGAANLDHTNLLVGHHGQGH
jgi:hypothetical protein